MEDSGSRGFPVALQWDLGPEKLRQMKNKLLLYFGSRKKSNGGECVMEDMDCTKGHVLIHFTQETERDRVLRKQNHILNLSPGNTINLILTLPEATDSETAAKGLSSELEAQESGTPKEKRILLDPGLLPPPTVSTLDSDNEDKRLADPPSSLVLIENVQDPCTLDVLNLLLENVTGTEMIRDFQVEMVPEIRVAVVTFTCNIDLPDFIEEFHGNPRARNLNLAAKLVEETRSVRVEGLPPNTSEDFIILYFESPKHGGGSVTDTRLVPEESAAIVTFQDGGVTRTVLAMKHAMGRTDISVYPYYVSLGTALYGKSGPPVTTPDPLEFPVSPYILEFILNDAQGKPNIEEKMAAVYCDITWPEVTCPNPVMTLCIARRVSTHARTLVKIVPTWRDKVSAEYKLLISKYRVAEFPVSEAVWEAVRRDVGSSAYARVLLKPNVAKEKLFLAGFVKDVTQTEPVLGKLIENTRRRVHRETHSATDEMTLAPALYEIMSRNGLEKNVRILLPQLKMSYDGSRGKLLLCGLREEISESKCKVMEMERSLKHTSLSPDPHIVRFLKVTSSEEMSCALFIRANINAMFQVEGDAIKLTGFSAGDLSEAEKIIKQELLCKKVTVEDRSLLKSTEWQSLDRSMRGGFNAETCRFLMEESHSGEEHQVVISGLSLDVKRVYETIQGFIQENTKVTEDIRVQSMAVAHFIQDKNVFWENIRKMSVETEITPKSITLSGPRKSVLEAAGLVDAVLSALYTKTLRIDKPGAKKFCVLNDEVHVASAKTMFKCVIHLQKDGEGSVGDAHLGDLRLQMTISGGVTVAVYKGDLSQHRVDVVVNAANEDLKHIGGLALALLKAAGPKLQTDCDQIIRRNGKLPTGESVMTDAGNLPCKHVIHTVGPRWDPSSQPRCELLLRKAITRSLELAAEKGHRSIAIPAVSSGVFGFPVKRSVENIIEAIREYAEDQGEKAGLKTIHLVDNNVQTVQIFVDCVRSGFRDHVIGSPTRPQRDPRSNERDKPPVVARSSAEKVAGTGGELAIRLVLQSIQDASTDVIVNSLSSDLNLSSGGSSLALLQKAGPDLQDLVDEESEGRDVRTGLVVVTDACNLNAKKVFHTVTPKWDNGQGSSEETLRRIIKHCLLLTEQQGLRSISFPAMGTGMLGFPKQVVASLMFDVIGKFSTKNDLRHLQEVCIVVLPSDTDTVRAFSAEAANPGGASSPGAGGAHSAAGNISTFFGSVTSPDLGVHEMKIGPITYQVKTGDITSENTSVIVSSSNENFTLQTGVSKAILSAAGPGVVAECVRLGAQPHKGYIVTSNGSLACQYILHVAGQTDPSRIKQSILLALQECEQLQVTSVAFPALGTGAGTVPAALVADAMIDAVVDFVTKKLVQRVLTVKVIVFQNPMLNDFYTSMKKKEISDLQPQQSIFQKITSFFTPAKKPLPQKLSAFQLTDNIEPAIFHFCAESSASLEAAASWLQKRILEEQTESTFTDSCIPDLEVSEMQKFSELQKRLQVHVEYKPSRSSVCISGLTRDVAHAELEIRLMIGKLKERKLKEKEADVLKKTVEWKYEERGRSISFDNLTSLELEEAERNKKKSVDIKIGGRTFTVNMRNKTATDRQGALLKLERLEKQDEKSIELPPTWDAMGNSLMKVVPLQNSNAEYRGVQIQFAKTCSRPILKIERIQNKHLWQNYQIRKQNIDAKNGNASNERDLFHGTDPRTVAQINKNGFNRSYAGLHAAAFGNGTYFAVNANYSVSYAPHDSHNQRFMYLAKVLTGTYCQGQGKMIAPPAKTPADPTDLHDSVTDNVQNPSMFVIFNDVQAYPEYLITFS